MLRTRSAVRPLTREDRDAALEVCARNLTANVFVAARIVTEPRASGDLLGHFGEGGLDALAWAGANIVPVETSEASRALIADRVRRFRGRTASILGPRDQVADLWGRLGGSWGPARNVREHQPLLETRTMPSALGVGLDLQVRPARPDEVDLVLPAAEHMFTHEIGYRPYAGSARGYRGTLAALIGRGDTWVVRDGDEIVFKTDIGSRALGVVQLQGVWLTPRLRGLGLATAMIASVVEQLLRDDVDTVSLYVNDFNTAALAAYDRVGFRRVGEFSTVLF